MSKSNRFSALETEDVGQTDIFKKAAKKLREIDKLKQKSVHNTEELIKLSTESHWRNILNPRARHVDEKAEAERKAKQHAKYAKKQAKIQEEAAHKKAEEAEKKAEHQRAKAERAKKQRDSFINSLTGLTDALEIEFRDMLIKTGYNINKTFRVLSKKYHPDRNIGNKEWAETKQKHLLNCKEKFVALLPVYSS
jgi:cation transport ATPase